MVQQKHKMLLACLGEVKVSYSYVLLDCECENAVVLHCQIPPVDKVAVGRRLFFTTLEENRISEEGQTVY